MIYEIEITYAKPPAFCTRINANCAETAKANAVVNAKKNGFFGKIKKITARRESND